MSQQPSASGGVTVDIVLAERAPTSGVPAAPPAAEGGEVIMVVEDNVTIRELVISVLTRRKYQVYAADSAAAALRVWGEHGSTVRLLITDIGIPGEITGAQLAAQFQSERPELLILFMSGYAHDTADREFMLQQENRLLKKPFTIEHLVHTVRRHLDAARLA